MTQDKNLVTVQAFLREKEMKMSRKNTEYYRLRFEDDSGSFWYSAFSQVPGKVIFNGTIDSMWELTYTTRVNPQNPNAIPSRTIQDAKTIQGAVTDTPQVAAPAPTNASAPTNARTNNDDNIRMAVALKEARSSAETMVGWEGLSHEERMNIIHRISVDFDRMLRPGQFEPYVMAEDDEDFLDQEL